MLTMFREVKVSQVCRQVVGGAEEGADGLEVIGESDDVRGIGRLSDGVCRLVDQYPGQSIQVVLAVWLVQRCQ